MASHVVRNKGRYTGVKKDKRPAAKNRRGNLKKEKIWLQIKQAKSGRLYKRRSSHVIYLGSGW